MRLSFFFFNDTATTEIYTLSLHDALPISLHGARAARGRKPALDARREHLAHRLAGGAGRARCRVGARVRSEEHTSELQSRQYLVCRLLLDKKKNPDNWHAYLACTSWCSAH